MTFGEDGSASAELVGVDRDLGVALLEVDTGEVEPLAWAPADAEVGIGTAVIALANPGGRGVRASLGFVAAADRGFRGPRGRRVSGALEHTATLPRGSAGGPLLDAEGRLLGVNALRLEGGPDRRPRSRLGAAPGGRAAWRAGRSPRARSSAWRLRRRTWRAGCGGRSACRSETACSFAASRTRARRLARGSSEAT